MSQNLKHIEQLLIQGRALAHRHRLQLILALRVTLAALAAFALAQALHLRLPLWAVLTSLIVTQMSLGRSLKVASDYLTGTFGGVAYGGALAILIPHDSEWALLGVLALAIAPLALIASFRTNFNVLPVTAIIVLLVPTMQHVSPFVSALDRVLEVVVGGAVGFAVSLLVWPSRGHALTTEAAAGMLNLMSEALSELIGQGLHGPETIGHRRIQDGIGAALMRLAATGIEAEHERTARLTSAPDTGPLVRTLLRLRHDVVMLGRAVGCELPEAVTQRLSPPLKDISAAATDFMRKSGAALQALDPPPPLQGVDSAFKAYAEELGAVRRDGLTRDMSSETVERFFALGFALDQMHEHVADLHRVVSEWAVKE